MARSYLLFVILTFVGVTLTHEMNIVDSSQSIDLSDFEIDLASNKAHQLLESLQTHQNLVSIDSLLRSSKLNTSAQTLKSHLVGEHGRQLWNTTQESQKCKQCIDSGFIWCPTASRTSGYCCEKTENCPRAGGCSTDYQLLEF
jgi:hypothetical protein